MSNFIKVSVWFILFIVVSSVGFSMLNVANTIENIIGFIIMVYTIAVTINTRFLTTIKFKRKHEE